MDVTLSHNWAVRGQGSIHMALSKRYLIAAIIALVVAISGISYFSSLGSTVFGVKGLPTESSTAIACGLSSGVQSGESRLTSTAFGAVTKFALPLPERDPNGIISESDGSVWFGEEALPGVAHLFAFVSFPQTGYERLRPRATSGVMTE